MRIIAIDWSGAKVRSEKKIWLAEATADGTLLRLETGCNREQIAAYLIEEAHKGEPMVVGLDFAFSFPAWFMEQKRYRGAPALWEALAFDGEADRWLAACEWPLWGRPGHRKPTDITEHFRATEKEVGAIAGIGCKSVFQIGGAGAVGTGSLRGMPVLHRLHEEGFAIWPFTAPARATAIEIYPRLLTGPVRKSDPRYRRAHVDEHEPNLPRDLREAAAASEDAFDAAVSALAMSRHAGELAALRQASDARGLLEGAIWQPEAPSDD